MSAKSKAKQEVESTDTLAERMFLSAPQWYGIDFLRPSCVQYKVPLSDDAFARFAASLKNGVAAIHIAECKESLGTLEICDGNHRYAALLRLGVKRVLAYHHGILSRDARLALSIRLNAEWFPIESTPFAECLKEIIDADSTALDSMPFDEVEVDRLIMALNVDLTVGHSKSSKKAAVDEEEESPVGVTHTAPAKRLGKTIECPECGATFNL